jgi:hypothetical protein
VPLAILDGLTVIDISVVDIDPCVDPWFAQAHAPPLVEGVLQVMGVVLLGLMLLSVRNGVRR